MSRFFDARRRDGRARQPRSGLRVVADLALAVVLLALLALVVARLDEGAAVRLQGPASVGDGDSLVIGTERIRLRGIDAPELDQICRRDGRDYPCGRESRAFLAGLIGSRPVACEGRERDRYQRLLADCHADRIALAPAQVEAGWAVAYGDYEREEAAARERGRGLWSGDFERPRDWRDRHGAAAEAEHARPSAILAWLRAFLGFP